MSVSTHYTAGQRRALNQIWSASGEYGFEPLFMALRGGGESDLYMNCVVGSLRRWYGEDMPRTLFAAWAGDRRQELLDGLCWLALESAVYARELPERPVLEKLRRACAEDFFRREHTLSRQEWMAKNQLAYTMQAARWRAVLDRRPPLLNPYERKLAQALDCGGLEGEALARTILDIFARFGLFRGGKKPASALRLHLNGGLAALAVKLRPSEVRHTDMIAVSPGRAGAGERGGRPDLRRGRLRLMENPETDREYIESCFGSPLLPQRELELLEQKLCTGVHFGCRLWVASGVPDAAHARRRDTRHLIEQSLLQAKRNRDAYAQDSALCQSAITRLTGRIRDCLQTCSQSDWEPARQGRLDASRAWRGAVLGDGRVFLRETAGLRPGFSVDLLLDASASRLHCQESVSAQGYILSESLSRCGIPVRVSGFCSVRGYTVLRVFKDFGNRSDRIFRYFASGWNRDGLALRAAGALPGSAPGERRLLLLLTDAAPSDSRRIPPGGKYPLGRDYDGAPAVEDTAHEVRALQRQGVRVAAVFMGHEAQAAKTIYGRSLAHIRSIDQLAAAAGTLIQNEIRELSD